MTPNISESNKKIAQNTLYMYFRMLISLVVSLFTAGVVFRTLGIDNFGIYNVVGSIIIFFSFLNSGLSSATKCYVTNEIATGTKESARHIFNTCVLAHIIISLFVLLFAETIGLLIINDVLNIPSNRITAANWVFQLSVISALIGIIQSPFGAAIVAYEKMSIYAYFSILDVISKLAIIYLVQYLPGDKLIIYAWLIFTTVIINISINCIYCYSKFSICKWKYQKDIPLLKNIFKFTSLSLFGQAAVVGTNQGVTILINIYFNLTINAALGISNQIVGYVNNFVANFQIAFNPQIIKSYATGNYKYLILLIIRTSKISSFLVIIFLVPLLFETSNVLTLWLGNYPQYTVEFCMLTFISLYLEAISAPLWMLQYSQTNIKQYQIIISTTYGLIFPITWLLLLFDNILPYNVITVKIVIFIMLLIIRLVYAKRLLSIFKINNWLLEVVGRGFAIIFLSSLTTGYFATIINAPFLLHIIIITTISLACTLPLIFLLGFNSQERKIAINLFNTKILHRKKNELQRET